MIAAWCAFESERYKKPFRKLEMKSAPDGAPFAYAIFMGGKRRMGELSGLPIGLDRRRKLHAILKAILKIFRQRPINKILHPGGQ